MLERRAQSSSRRWSNCDATASRVAVSFFGTMIPAMFPEKGSKSWSGTAPGVEVAERDRPADGVGVLSREPTLGMTLRRGAWREMSALCRECELPSGRVPWSSASTASCGVGSGAVRGR